MPTEVIVLNGGSSAGKTSIAARLQELLEQPWITLAVDDLLDKLPASLVGRTRPQPGRPPLISFGPGGEVDLGPGWPPVEAAWYVGVAGMARAGLGVIVDEVLLSGGEGQRRLAAAFEGLEVLWVGVRCDPAVAAAREAARVDRVAGMAADQAERVHAGADYNVVVDTTSASAEDCARAILAHVKR
ncbi:MAG TPA: AAA family ATPase [Acidimicrobiales bacterium]|nr:AAA family ATPase [Acidimicrobiales bacterium]